MRESIFEDVTEKLKSILRQWPTLPENERLLTADALIKEVVTAGESIVDPNERSIVSNLSQELAGKVFDITGRYPLIRLAEPSFLADYSKLEQSSLENRRVTELRYLDELIVQYQYWSERYTPLAGIAEIRAAGAGDERLDLPMLFMPMGFEKLIEHGFGPERKIERVAVDDLRSSITKYRRIVLLGEPGSGKTTTLFRLLYDYAMVAKQDPSAPLPIFVPLGSYTGNESVLKYAETFFSELGSYLAAYLRSRRAILLLDGLNEMPRHGYRERVERIRDLLDQYPESPVVVTCRSLDYVESLKLEKLEVRPLDVTRQRAYLHRYLGNEVGEKLFWNLAGGDAVADLWGIWKQAGATWEQFWSTNEVPEKVLQHTTTGQDNMWCSLRKGELSTLLSLSENPYLLIMFAQIYLMRDALPSNRGQLFASFVDVLLERERRHHGVQRWLGNTVICSSLATLAFAMQMAGESGTAVDRTWAEAEIAKVDSDPEEVLYLSVSASLLDLSDGQVRFVHQLIQEYFAALALQSRLENNKVPPIPSEEWLQPSKWEETAILLAGILPDMTTFIYSLLPVNPRLAARCIVQSGGTRPSSEVVSTVQQKLEELATGLTISVMERNAAGDALNLLGDSRRGVSLQENGLPDILWCQVPDGDFLMGSTGEKDNLTKVDETPQHTVSTSSYQISLYPITNAQFKVFVDDGGYTETWWDCWTGIGWAWVQQNRIVGPHSVGGIYDLPNHPVVGVSWYEAVAYCRWLSIKFNRSIFLPTETQWEKAARGVDGRYYPWGQTPMPDYANYAETGIGTTSAVGLFPGGQSPYDLLDVSGNIWEYTGSEYRLYPYTPDDGREDYESDVVRVLRGGSFDDQSMHIRCMTRLWLNPIYRVNFAGFRVVLLDS